MDEEEIKLASDYLDAAGCFTEAAGILRDYAARLREDDENAKDAARYRWLRDWAQFP